MSEKYKKSLTNIFTSGHYFEVGIKNIIGLKKIIWFILLNKQKVFTLHVTHSLVEVHVRCMQSIKYDVKF